MNNMKFLNKKAQKHFRYYFKSHFEKIEVRTGICRFNYQCHMNAVHDAVIENDCKVAMVVYIWGTIPILHFIKVDKDNIYTDNTLGYWAKHNNYYLIRLIDKSEFTDIDIIFEEYRKELRRKLPFWIRLFSNYCC